MEAYTLRRIIEDNAKNMEAKFNLIHVLLEADQLQAQLPKHTSFKTRVRIACALLGTAIEYHFNKEL